MNSTRHSITLLAIRVWGGVGVGGDGGGGCGCGGGEGWGWGCECVGVGSDMSASYVVSSCGCILLQFSHGLIRVTSCSRRHGNRGPMTNQRQRPIG